MEAGINQHSSPSQNSDEGTKPIRTDEAVAELANISRDTIRKVEKIEATAPEEVKVLARAADLASR